jgi:hypothetical protein
LWNELGVQQSDATVLYQDNLSAISIHEAGRGTFKRSKHILVRGSFITEHIKNKIIRLQYLSTNEMLADLLTKALQMPVFSDLCNRLFLKIYE